MERTIIFPKWEKNEIPHNQVEQDVKDRGGMILVYDKEGTIIGHVIPVVNTWFLTTANISADAASLEELMVDYSGYTFKLIN